MKRVAGHSLVLEGAPHDENGKWMPGGWASRAGRARCTCGALSPNLPSGRQRKQWHREHKAEVAK